MDNDAPSVKQQLIETLRGAESVVITTKKNPNKDQIAAAIGLHLLLDKLDKVSEVIIASDIPMQLEFLPAKFINKKLQGQRDFIVEIDQSRTEADHLKYVTEQGKLKIYITPYNGSFSKDDVAFDYGDYHCDAIIGLGAQNTSELDDGVAKEQKLTQNTPFLLIHTGSSAQGTNNAMNWNDPNASSVCEMIMSMSEALGSGLLDQEIATALFTGIVDNTNHFTNQVTTPKVMTMAAQLLAAGAKQAEVIKQLSLADKPVSPVPPVSTGKVENDGKAASAIPEPPKRAPNEFQIRRPKHVQTGTQPVSAQPAGVSPDATSVRSQPKPPETTRNDNQPKMSEITTPGKVSGSVPTPTAPIAHGPQLPPLDKTVPQDSSGPGQAGIFGSAGDQVQTVSGPHTTDKTTLVSNSGDTPHERVIQPPAASRENNPKPSEPAKAAGPVETPAAGPTNTDDSSQLTDANHSPAANLKPESNKSGAADEPASPAAAIDLEAARRAVEEAHKEGDNQNQTDSGDNPPHHQ